MITAAISTLEYAAGSTQIADQLASKKSRDIVQETMARCKKLIDSRSELSYFLRNDKSSAESLCMVMAYNARAGRPRRPRTVDAMELHLDRLNRVQISSLSGIMVVTLIPVPFRWLNKSWQ
jgi:hypothetical protein